MPAEPLLQIYDRLYRSYGPQDWWPADTPFEVMVGAVLTQNTAWTNVEKAITNLKQANCLDATALTRMPDKKLAKLIRPSGYFNIKTKRLKNLCRWLQAQGGVQSAAKMQTGELRTALLGINGVGPETADDILLYAFERCVFVIDVYTRRLFSRLGMIEGNEPYEELRHYFESRLEANTTLFGEYHALIVRHAKEKCTDRDGCRHCFVEERQG